MTAGTPSMTRLLLGYLGCAFVCILAFACLAGRAAAQDIDALANGGAAATTISQDAIETDRDSFTPAISTAGAGRTVVEASYSFIDNRTNPDTNSVPELLVRHGLGKWIEIRLGWNFEAGGPGAPITGDEFGGQDFNSEQEGRFLYGAKVQTSLQSGWLPESVVIVHADTPSNGPSTATTLVLNEAFGWTFANNWQWNSAMRLGTAYEGLDYFNNWAPSTVLKIPIGDRWNFHTEYFGIVSSQKAVNFSQHFLSVGGHVLVTQNLELGLRFGFGLNEQSSRFFNNVGFGWRF